MLMDVCPLVVQVAARGNQALDGPTYRIQITSDDLTVDSSVYAPLNALMYEDPPHPDRADILRFIETWLSIVEVVGEIDGFDADAYRGLFD